MGAEFDCGSARSYTSTVVLRVRESKFYGKNVVSVGCSLVGFMIEGVELRRVSELQRYLTATHPNQLHSNMAVFFIDTPMLTSFITHI